MKVIVQGAPLTLAKTDYLAGGGEGDVYVKGATAFKIYHDPSRMIPLGKIQELQAIPTHNVIRPLHVIYSTTQAPIGYTMPFVTDTWALCQLFTRTFRDREGLDGPKMAALIQQLRDTVATVHSAQALVVDLNEMNGIVRKDFSSLYLLDADSFQTPHYPATALMESVRDRHSKTFSPGTDWFAYAILSFQMFVGIHPYKGKHPGLTTLDERMKLNVSVLDPAVTVPKACYSFDVIPAPWRDWYTAVFQRGERSAPPVNLSATAPMVPTQILQATRLIVVQMAAYQGVLHTYLEHGGQVLAASSDGVWLDGRPQSCDKGAAAFGFDAQQRAFAVHTEADGARVTLLLNGTSATLRANIRALSTSEGNVYAHVGEMIYRIDLHGKLLATLTAVAPCAQHATWLFEGGAFQNLLGEPHVTFLFPGGASTLAVPELKGQRVVDACRRGSVLVVIGEAKGVFTRFVFHAEAPYFSYTFHGKREVPTAAMPNFAVTDSGIAVLLNEDDDLEVFAASKGFAGMKVLLDPSLRGDMKLVGLKGRIGYLFGNALYSMRM